MKYANIIQRFLTFIIFIFPLYSTAQDAVGSSMYTPIYAGNYGVGTFTFTDTKTNITSTGPANKYGQRPNNIFYYVFTAQGEAQVTISYSGLFPYPGLTLRDVNGNYITSGTIDPSLMTYSSINTTLPAGTYFVVSQGNWHEEGTITTTINVNIKSVTSTFKANNHIRTWDATAPEKDPNVLIGKDIKEVKQTTTYYDGLGRPAQTVIKSGSLSAAGKGDIVSPVVYSGYGVESKKYLPYVATDNNGYFKIDPLASQKTFYDHQLQGQNEAFYYSHINYEPSPLNRVEKTMAPGNSWAGSDRGIENKYWVNKIKDSVVIWNVSANATTGQFADYTYAGMYTSGGLFKNVTIDEHGKQAIEFKNKTGQVILKKVQLTAVADDGAGSGYNGWLCTYYIYDDWGNLRSVIQPNAVEQLAVGSWQLSDDLLREQCFQYLYDYRNRMVMKQVPGAAPVYMVYDARNRLVMTQDGNMRTQNKWLVTVYENAFNRPIQTGVFTNSTSFTQHLDNAKNAITYPATIANWELLTVTHYDNYDGLPAPLISSIDQSTINAANFITVYNTVPEYAQKIQADYNTKGLVTWTQTKVLGTANQFISSVNLYDDKGRVIQVQAINATGGRDVLTTQYDWSGKVLRTHVQQENKNANEIISVATKNMYDDLGRVTQIEKNINNTGWKPIVAMEYDALGQLKRKVLGTGGTVQGAGIEAIEYDYNIRGWLLGANRTDLLPTNKEHYFSFALDYDKPCSFAPSSLHPQYNGNIGAMLWKSKGDNEVRKYDYDYDAASRILKADFSDNLGYNFNVKMGDGIDPLSAYDANGNILRMQQWGLKGIANAQIDDLSYNYQNHSNKLQAVSDAQNDNNSTLGDFKYDSTTKTNVDYAYDTNGNMIADKNKGITSIAYNHLNLPERITFSPPSGGVGGGLGGSIEYVYDAAGNKLKKIVTDNTANTKNITTYLGGSVYESRGAVGLDTLQFIAHEEGRARMVQGAGGQGAWAYDFFLKDHLGNVRMVLTDEEKTDVYSPLSFESANSGIETDYYENADKSIVDRPGAFGNNTDQGSSVQLLKKYGQEIGGGKLLKIMAGDKVNVAVDYYTPNDATDNSNANGANTLLMHLAGLLNGGAAGGILKGGGDAVAGNLNNTSSFISMLMPQGSGQYNDMPKAYLNILFFDEQFKFVQQNSLISQIDVKGNKASIIKTGIEAPKNGYAYIYINNESNNLVYFDNLHVSHERGKILSEDHYYPFGLTMAGISSKAMSFGGAENKLLLGSKELQDEMGLNLYDYEARLYDMYGRMNGIDPMADQRAWVSPYSFVQNNPINRIDPTGMLDDWYLNETSGELYYNKNETMQTIKKGEETLTRIGDDDLFGEDEVKGVVEKVYDQKVSQELATKNGYSIDPVQQLHSELSHKMKVPTGRKAVEYNTGTESIINEKYSFNPQITSQENSKSEILAFKMSQNKAEMVTGGTTTMKISREYYSYKEISKTSKAIGTFLSELFKAGMGLSGNHSDIHTIYYKSWSDYRKQTGGKGPLLKYEIK